MDYSTEKDELIHDNCAVNDINITRKIYLQEELNDENNYNNSTTTVVQRVKTKIKSSRISQCTTNLIPSSKWLLHYDFKQNLFGDVVSGITVAIMHIPQGMAYALLANAPPIFGIYMAFFPVIVYILFGTSRHISIGTFAIVCLMCGSINSKYLDEYNIEEITSTISFTVGIMLLVMFCLRAGVLTNLLSDTLVSGFTCACSFLIMFTQLKVIFGVRPKRAFGHFRLIKDVISFGIVLPNTNWCSVAISAVTITALLFNNYLFKPWLAKRTKIPFPIELAVVAVGTTSNYFFDFSANYNVTKIGFIPTGLPEPKLPVISLIPDIFLDCIPIACVSYAITMSMAIIFAVKDNYTVSPNQELFALGFSDIFGSFFSCLPISASLARSVVQHDTGGKTQMTSVISCSILVFVLLWIGPIFERLPNAVLASIIIVALKSLMFKVKEAKRFWVLNKWDFFVWICAFSLTILVSIEIGLYAGLSASVLSLFLRGHTPYTCILGNVPGTDLYLDISKYKNIKEVSGITIFRFCGGLNFATNASFKKSLWKMIGFEPEKMARRMEVTGEYPDIKMKCLIIDFAPLTFIDPQGVSTLMTIQDSLEKLDIQMYLASCSSQVYEVFQKVNKYYKKDNYFTLFPTIHDACLFHQYQKRDISDLNIVNMK